MGAHLGAYYGENEKVPLLTADAVSQRSGLFWVLSRMNVN